MTWLLYVIGCFLIAAVVISAPMGALVYYCYYCIKLGDAVSPNTLPTPWKKEVVTTTSEEGRNHERLPTKDENKRNVETECNLRRRQQKSIESEEYWASDESGERSNGRKSPVKKQRGKKGSQTRFGVTDSSDSSVSVFPQESKEKLGFLNSGTERDSDESALRGKPVNYSGNGSPTSSDSDSLLPVENYTQHVSMHVVAIGTIMYKVWESVH